MAKLNAVGVIHDDPLVECNSHSTGVCHVRLSTPDPTTSPEYLGPAAFTALADQLRLLGEVLSQDPPLRFNGIRRSMCQTGTRYRSPSWPASSANSSRRHVGSSRATTRAPCRSGSPPIPLPARSAASA